MLKISIACDHAGYEKKEEIKKFLASLNYEVLDFGTYSLDSCDYPIFAEKAARCVSEGSAKFGILICSSGEGVAIAANKVKGIRCGIGYNEEVSMLLRKHNDANMISFGAEYTSLEELENRIKIFLSTEFEGGRHERRVNLLKDMEK